MQKKKSLGQHFLKSQKAVETMLDASDVMEGDVILEIGPGEGVLTFALLEAGAEVIAVEKDERLIPILKEKFKKQIEKKQLTLIHDDVLKIKDSLLPKKKYKLIANIPYYITGQIIRKFLERKHQPISATLLVQKEVAERIIARDKKESLLSLSVKAFGAPIYVQTVKAGSFSPPPKVDSAILHIGNISRKNFKKTREDIFFTVIHAGFAHKRKQLLSNLSSLYPKESLILNFEKLQIKFDVRAEDLTLETWVSLCTIISE